MSTNFMLRLSQAYKLELALSYFRSPRKCGNERN
jgi:hypothetical protein